MQDQRTIDAYPAFASAGQPAQQPMLSLGPSLPRTMKYGLLRQTHQADPPHDRGYDAKVWHELDDLYRGGYQIAAHAHEYLPKAINEHPDRWKERCALAAYIGYFGRIVEAYGGAIFAKSVSVGPAGDAEDPETPGELPDRDVYDAFGRDTDLCGASFAQVLRRATTTALVKGKALVAVDFPAIGAEPKSRAESDAFGVARPYAYCLEPECLIDWEYESEIQQLVKLGDDREIEFTVGRFAWVIVRKTIRRRASPDELRSAPVEEYRIWRKLDDGTVTWQVYRTPPLKEGRLDDNADIPLVADGSTAFREIPIVEIRLPDTLWLGNVIGPLNKEHWQRRSALLAAQQRSLLVIPTVYLGPETPGFQQEIMAEVQQDPSRGEDPATRYRQQGYLCLGKDDELAFEGPDGGPFEHVDKQLDKLVDEIYRVAGQMASGITSSTSAQGRSGLSKAYDHNDFTTVVSAIAAIIADGARRVYTVISDARREDVVWTVHGLSGYEEIADRAVLLEEALQIDSIGIPSATFKREYRLDLAKKLLPGRDPATMATIRKEIVENTSDEEAAPAPELPPEQEDEEEPESEPGGASSFAKPGTKAA